MHYEVLVVGENIEEILEPFQIGGKEVHPIEKLEFEDQEDELRERASKVITSDSWAGGKHPEAVGKTYLEYYGNGDFDKFAMEWSGVEKDDITGRYGYWTNRNGHWDWYEIGGRWTGEIKIKAGAKGSLGVPGVPQQLGLAPYEIREDYVDSARKKDIDFAAMHSNIHEDLREQYIAWHTASEKERESFWIPESAIPKEGETEVEYAERLFTPWSCYAIIINGQWFASAYYDRKAEKWVDIPNWKKVFWDKLNSVDGDELITIVDMHA